MIRFSQLSLRRGAKLLLEGADATLNLGERIGLIGANGSGKSSLFALLCGELHADKGDAVFSPQWRVAQKTPALDRPAVEYAIDGGAFLRVLEKRLLLSVEVMDIDRDFARAFRKSQLAAHNAIPPHGCAFVHVDDEYVSERILGELCGVGLGATSCDSQEAVRTLTKRQVEIAIVICADTAETIQRTAPLRRAALVTGIPYVTTERAAAAIMGLRTITQGLPTFHPLQHLSEGIPEDVQPFTGPHLVTTRPS